MSESIEYTTLLRLLTDLRNNVDDWTIGTDIATRLDEALEFLHAREVVAADTAEAWRNLIHGEDHEALLRVRAEIDDMYSTSSISQSVHRALIARIDGRPTESDLTEQYFAEQDGNV